MEKIQTISTAVDSRETELKDSQDQAQCVRVRVWIWWLYLAKPCMHNGAIAFAIVVLCVEDENAALTKFTL